MPAVICPACLRGRASAIRAYYDYRSFLRGCRSEIGTYYDFNIFLQKILLFENKIITLTRNIWFAAFVRFLPIHFHSLSTRRAFLWILCPLAERFININISIH
jgi:hypothetical protein